MIPAGWKGTVEIDVLDDSIPPDEIERALTAAGLRIGVGRFRPSKGGTNGRFVVDEFREQQ